ncbi:RcnB family protein [Sphingomonas sp. RP10(2022)]|uniref:17 kDa surface antigen n=1 Tax=Sphingomonas liriopis TaxID=2949094 RepID=A0A9X2KTG8_9SPHN|nr:RcnB family protein [Sphingomonas liriopis]MCP3734893.1 RcnB family protein [Sphingomonas liriopis]
MRNMLIAAAGLALAGAGTADAQQRVVAHGPGASFPAPRGGMAPAPVIHRQGGNWQGGSWQGQRQGQWQGQRQSSQSQSQSGTWQHSSQSGGWQGGSVQHGSVQQGSWQHGVPGQPVRPVPQHWQGNGARPPIVHPGGGSRWGSKVGGRWWGGANAPGGWNAYHRPYRGYALPSYWIAPRFYINDWQTYGLTQPSYGYNWVRYYDDAVLVDGRGSVYDTRAGIDWDRYDDAGYAGDDRVYADGGYDDRGYDDRGYDDRGYDARYARRDNGVGGAVTGAVVGGVAGNLIAGRGNRLGGTLIGAGVGAAAGYAIDKAEDRRGPPPPPPVYRGDRGYDVPVAPAYAPPPPPPVGYAPGNPAWRSADGTTTVTTTNGAGGYYRGGYYYPGASTTTVVVQTAPVVTTTTTEIYEDAVTYTRRPVVHTKTKRVWRPAPKCACR